MKTGVTVTPEPGLTLSDADRETRYRAVMSAYTLEQQLLPARDAERKAGEQAAAIRQYLMAAGAGGGPMRSTRSGNRRRSILRKTATAPRSLSGASDTS